jgi:type I restriction enzyme S subunit
VAKIDELAAKIEDARRLRQLALEESEALTYSTCQELFGKPDKAVGDIADVTKLAGFEYTEYFSQAVPGNVIVVRAGNVRNRGLDLSNAMTITEEVSDALPRSQLKSGDVLMTFIGAKIGDVTYVRPDHPRLHCGPNVAKMTPHRCISTIYLVKVLQSSLIQHQIEEITKSTAQPSLSMRTIRQMKLPVPSLSEQQEIVAYMDKVQAKVDASKQLQKQTATELDALLLSILDKAFNGEL